MSKLAGSCILITRMAGDNGLLQERIDAAGGMSLVIPMIRVAPPADPSALERARSSLASFDWIALTSRHAARALLAGVVREGERPRIAAVGGATAAEAEALGWRADLVAEGKGALELADRLVNEVPEEQLRNLRILHPCSSLALPMLAESLANTGVTVERVEAYQTLPPGDAERQDLLAHLEWINGAVFASPSAVKHFLQVLGSTNSNAATTSPRGGGPPSAWACAAIGATTRAALEEAGFAYTTAAARPDADALFVALTESWKRSRP